MPLVTPTTLLLGNAGLLGLGITRNVTLGTLAKALTGWADFEFDGTAWQQTASGGLL